MKKLLILLSILFALISCKNSVSTPNYNRDNNGGSQVSSGVNTSLPIWNVKHSTIPEEYWGKYQYLDEDGNLGIATVTGRDITIYYSGSDGNFHVGGYFHVFDKNAEYRGNNTWRWNWNYRGDNYINKDKNDFRLSPAPEYIMTFKRNEKGQRVLFYIMVGSYVHEDDMNK